MTYKKVLAGDQGGFTTVQHLIGNKGKKFEAYGEQGHRIKIYDGTILAVKDLPTISADNREYYEVENYVEIGATMEPWIWKLKPLPFPLPRPAYVKGIDLDPNFHPGATGSEGG
jgi:hypothetical protein